MSSQAAPNDIILYNYAFSPFGKRVSAYLALRGIDYALCEQPFIMPRPDLALLPVSYRRIPILAIGRDIYLDTRLILRTLEHHPSLASPKLGATKPQDLFLENLLERYMIEGPVFSIAAGVMPTDGAMDPTVKADRMGFLGKSWEKKEMDEGRAECLNYVRELYELLEKTILEDGREWILEGQGPKLADIHASFLLEFVSDMQIPQNLISDRVFPKTFAWLTRYRAAVAKAKATAPESTDMNGQAAAEHIHRAELLDMQISVDVHDPSTFEEGVEVEIYPADWGTEHRDCGRLVGLTPDKVTIAVKNGKDVEIRIHAPRTGFKIGRIERN